MCLFIVECGYAVSVGIVLQKNRTEPSTEIWGQKPIETDRKCKIPHRNNTNVYIHVCILFSVVSESLAVNFNVLDLAMLIPEYLDTRVPCGLPGSRPGSRETSDLPIYRDCLHQSTDCLCGHIQASTALAAAENAERPVC